MHPKHRVTQGGIISFEDVHITTVKIAIIISKSIHVQENGSKLVNLIYRKVLQLGNDQCMCNNLVLHKNGWYVIV